MKRYFSYILLMLATIVPAAAQQPLYIVNGVVSEQIASIPPGDIETVESLPADEQTIARYGERAAHGVILITLNYDQPATFKADTTFASYIAQHVTWGATEPAARVVLRYRITPEGETIIEQELESTDSRLKRRVMKALATAPRWSPAQKDGKPVTSEGVLHIQLPAGKPMPHPVELVFR